MLITMSNRYSLGSENQDVTHLWMTFSSVSTPFLPSTSSHQKWRIHSVTPNTQVFPWPCCDLWNKYLPTQVTVLCSPKCWFNRLNWIATGPTRAERHLRVICSSQHFHVLNLACAFLSAPHSPCPVSVTCHLYCQVYVLFKRFVTCNCPWNKAGEAITKSYHARPPDPCRGQLSCRASTCYLLKRLRKVWHWPVAKHCSNFTHRYKSPWLFPFFFSGINYNSRLPRRKVVKSAFIRGKAHFSFSLVLLFIVNVSFYCLFS